jgi:hypothetical protein
MKNKNRNEKTNREQTGENRFRDLVVMSLDILKMFLNPHLK